MVKNFGGLQARRLRAAVYARLDQMDLARNEARAFFDANPGFSITSWAAREPYEDPGELAR